MAEKSLFKKVVQELTKKNEEVIEEISRETYIHNKVIAFIGVAGGSGVTTLACSVALTLANRGKTVCLIDLNMRQPTVCLKMNTPYPPPEGGLLRRLYATGTPIKEVLVASSANSKLKILSASYTDKMLESSDLQESAVAALLAELRELFDVVVLDVPSHYEMETTVIPLIKADVVYTLFNNEVSCIQNFKKLQAFMIECGAKSVPYKVILGCQHRKLNIRMPKSKLFEVEYNIPFSESVILNSAAGCLPIQPVYNKGRDMDTYASICDEICDKVIVG